MFDALSNSAIYALVTMAVLLPIGLVAYEHLHQLTTRLAVGTLLTLWFAEVAIIVVGLLGFIGSPLTGMTVATQIAIPFVWMFLALYSGFKLTANLEHFERLS